ncbi:hypothetical protein QBC35DRAFT_490916 [Podospora australis]|uniref:Uncharacterized protein n=1 Tax=Podospora australis TaxID=1536484 RepID=A0AAN6X2B4_9PEZI|nr:hypothetical protein QBC35DRAFT_490916 [Podospora australis]
MIVTSLRTISSNSSCVLRQTISLSSSTRQLRIHTKAKQLHSSTTATASTSLRVTTPLPSSFHNRARVLTIDASQNTKRLGLSRALLSTTAGRTMASDEDYMSFLNKANEDPSAGVSKQQSTTQADKKEFRATEEGVEVPKPLTVAVKDAFYVSDADEPFKAVALGWAGEGRGLPDEEEFAQLIQHWDPPNAEIEILDPTDWDRNGQYNEIIEAVREAGKGNDVRVYRVSKGGVKAEYWVVTTEGSKLVGVKALAVES